MGIYGFFCDSIVCMGFRDIRGDEMTVLIKGMKMPQNCIKCHARCRLYLNGRKFRHPDCPLVEIPTPHGRLIDANKLLEKAYWDYNEATRDYNNFMVVSDSDIEDAPTVIEAE